MSYITLIRIKYIIPIYVYSGGSTGVQDLVEPTNEIRKKGGTIFLGTEDPHVIEVTKKWCVENDWKVFYTNIFDRTLVDASANWTVQNNNRKNRVERHHDYEYVSMLLNIDHHMRCNAFVCTIPSNFCRVIDELRASIGGKANRHYADIGESCGRIPCIDHLIADVGW